MHIDMIIVAAVAAIGILLAFIILAIEIAVTIIEFYIVTLIAFVVVPFGVLSQTSFLAEKAIGYVVSVGFKFMALAVIAGVGINIFETYTLSPQPTVAEEAGLLLSAIFLMMLSLKVPAIAGAMISGGPQLNTGGALMGAAGVAAGAAGVGLAARAAGGAIASGWAGGGEKIAAARAASGGLGSGGTSPGGGSGGGSGGGGMAADFARAPVSTMVAEGRAAGSRLFSSRNPTEGETPPPPPPDAPASGSSVVSRAEARRGGGLAGAARDSAAAATAGGEASGPGIVATPTRRDDEPEE
jgi:type IV secretion system protein TrbL